MDRNTEPNNRSQMETKEKVKQATADVQEKAASAAEEAKQKAASVADEAKQKARSTISTQKEEAASELHGVAQALRMTGDQLRDQEQTMAAQYSNKIADQVDHLSSYLEERSLDEVISEAETFARRQPEIFLGGAFTVGLLASRFLKSSMSDGQRNRERFSNRQSQWSGTRSAYPNAYSRYGDANERSGS